MKTVALSRGGTLALFVALAVVVIAAAIPAYDATFRTLALIFAAAALHCCALIIGTALMGKVGAGLGPERWWLGWALGLGTLGHLMALLGHMRLFVPAATVAVPLLAIVAAAVVLRRSLTEAPRELHESVADSWTTLWLVGAAMIAAFSLAPPMFHDAASYHLALPQQWMQWGRIVVDAHFPHSAMPLNAELALAPLMLATGDPRAGAIASGLEATLLLGLVAATGKRVLRAGGMSATVIATMPIVCFLAVGVKSDLLHAIFAAALLDQIARLADGPAPTAGAVRLGLFAGLCIATKTSGLMLLPAVLAALIALPTTRRALGSRGLVVACAVAAATAAPVFVQNAFWLGNPMFPLLSDLFGGAAGQREITAVLLAHSASLRWADVWRLPWDLTFTMRAATMNELAGPLLLLLAPLAVVLRPLPAGMRLILIVSAATVPGWLLTQPLLRYNPFVWISLGLLSGFVIARLWSASAAHRTALTCVLLVAVALSWGWTVRAHEVLMRRPSLYLAGGLDEQSYLAQAYEPYRAYRFINAALPTDAIVLQMGDMRLLYLERRAIQSCIYGPPPWLPALRTASAEDARAALRALGATHVIYSRGHVDSMLKQWGPQTAEERQRDEEALARLFDALAPALYDDGALQVYQL